MWLSFPPCVCVFFVDVLWHCSALASSRLWDRPVVWGAGSTPPALCLSTSRKKGDSAPAIVQIPANLQSQSPPFVLGQQWLRPLLLGRDGQVLPGRSQWLYIIDVSHRWVPFFSPLRHWLEKTSKWSPRFDQWQPGPSWNLTAGWGRKFHGATFLSHLYLDGVVFQVCSSLLGLVVSLLW